ncbi:hypothetical protein [Pseudomonas sp. ZL2]
MEMWELIKRLLGAATPNQSFSPGVVAEEYLRSLRSAGESDLPGSDEIVEIAEELSGDLEDIGLIIDAPQPRPGAVMLNRKTRTLFGDELYQRLQGKNVVALFENMLVDLDPGQIRQVLHQLDS